MGKDRQFPVSQVGDIVLIANAGAYGAVMSSRYNMRALASEITIDTEAGVTSDGVAKA
jgi:bifunctional diaminopimelate decarboxylase / aspartate kinase